MAKFLVVVGIAWGCWLHGTAWAGLDLVVLWPQSGFTTNNHEVRVRGFLSATEGENVLVSLSTPAGVPDLAATYPSLAAFSVDLGSHQSIAALAFDPLRDGGLVWGARRIRASFSEDGQSFADPVTLTVPLDEDDLLPPSHVELPSVVRTRYVQVEFLEGWQIGRVQIHEMALFAPSGTRLRSRVAGVSFDIPLNALHEATFEATIPIKDGENRLLLRAALDVVPFDAREHADSEAIQLTRLPFLAPDQAEDGQFVLGDGWQIELIAPADALGDTVRSIEMLPVAPTDIPPSSYREHRQMVAQAVPVLAYRFRISRRTAFHVTATAFFEAQPPELAVDGKTEYPSTWITSLVPLPVSLRVDLGSLYTLSAIKVYAHFDGVSLGPQKATLLQSEDGSQFEEFLTYTEFQDRITEIPFPEPIRTRHIEIRIDESKQANNIQINEIEFLDDAGAVIVPLVSSDRLTLERPALVRLFYEADDLEQAGVSNPMRLGMFLWTGNERGEGFWQYVGGTVDPERQSVEAYLNYLGPVALFETLNREIEAAWSFNPFSPDGDGIADTTGLTLRIPAATPKNPQELSVDIFDLGGRRVRSLLERELITANAVHVRWDGTDRTGRTVPIGPYIYQIQTEDRVFRGTIVVVK